jgi:hypothetical protein
MKILTQVYGSIKFLNKLRRKEMLTTDEALTFQVLLGKMTIDEIYNFVYNKFLIKAEDRAQDGDFKCERMYLDEAKKVRALISPNYKLF